MIVRFAEELYGTCRGKCTKTCEYFRGVLLKLFEGDTRYGKSYPDVRVLMDQLKQKSIGREITFTCNTLNDLAI